METFQVNPLADAYPSPEQVVHNCLLAEKLWRERVRPVRASLASWNCGSAACFGGHLATWPEFLALPSAGVMPSGAPYFADGSNVEGRLFGVFWMFNTRSAATEGDPEVTSDYEVVLQRLARCIELARSQQP